MTKRAIRWTLVLSAFAVVLTVVGFNNWGNSMSKDQLVMRLVYDALEKVHYNPREVNDELSLQVYKQVLEDMDIGKRFFTRDEVKAFAANELDLDDQFRQGSSTFFDQLHKALRKHIPEVQGYYREILAEPFNFEEDEVFNSGTESLGWAANRVELRDRWRKYLKYRVLIRVHAASRDTTEGGAPFDFVEAEGKAREQELEVHDNWLRNLEEMEREEWFGIYLNAFTTQFDPHTEYFPPRRQEDFEINMTGQLEGIGAQLRVRGNYVTVEKIVTGSASWRQGDLEEGDQILSVAQEDEEAVDVVGMSINKVVQLIRGPKGTKVTLSVKKKDGTMQDITIERDIVELEATFARSAVIEGERRIGYIRLPKFYVDFYKNENRNAAKDVEAQIEKLKAENVEGIVFDLRNNGGGSLQAAVDIVGLFIDRGPVVQVKDYSHSAKSLYDNESGTVYDGPLVVLVNEFSASASEIVAAAIQDYKRGLVIGPQSTHGKGTVQNMMDMDQMTGVRYSDLKPLGALKITIQKFYRINGETTQLQGVRPDVVLPFAYQSIDYGEKEYATALEVDAIEPGRYEIWDAYNASIAGRAIANSAARVDTSYRFKQIGAYADWLSTRQEETDVPLNFDLYAAEQDSIEEMTKQWKNLSRTSDTIVVLAPAPDLIKVESDEAYAEETRRWLKGLRRDLYLQEAVHVVTDLE